MLQTPQDLRKVYKAAKGLGDKLLMSDAICVPEGYGDLFLLFKEFPTPVLTVGEAAEVAMPFGMGAFQPSQIKTHQQAQFSLAETVKGNIRKFLSDVAANGGYFNCRIYEGSQDKYAHCYYLEDCLLQADPVGRDTESRAQVLYIAGTMFYHYFGTQDKQGNM